MTKSFIIHRVSLPALLVAVLLIAGCSPWATYPKIDGSANIGMPTFAPIPEVMASGIWWAYENRPLPPAAGEQIIFNLPDGSSPELYDKVFAQLNHNGRAMDSGDQWAYHVEEVRVRASSAEVDMYVPNAAGEHDFITVSMRHSIQGYRITDTRTWRIRRTVPGPTYIPPEQWYEDEQYVEVPTTTDDIAE